MTIAAIAFVILICSLEYLRAKPWMLLGWQGGKRYVRGVKQAPDNQKQVNCPTAS
jgi:hypothetical protein